MNSENIRKYYYPILDVLKYVFAILILVLHSTQYCNIYILNNGASGIIFRFFTDYLARLAVPFFFIITSFLLFKKMENKNSVEQKKILWKYVKHLLIIYCLWFVINIFWVFYEKIYVLLDRYNMPQIFLYLVRDIFLQNGFGGSWFIMASIIDAIIIFFLTRSKIGSIFAWTISIITYFICLIMTWYNFIMPNFVKNILDNINICFGKMYLSFPYGLLLFMLGKYISENSIFLVKFPLKLKVLLLILFSTLMLCEVFLIPLLPNYYRVSATSFAFSPFVVFMLATIGISYPSFKNIDFFVLIRNYSSIIYYSHAQILRLFIILNNRLLHLENIYIVCALTIFVALILTNLLAFVIVKLSKKDKFKCLKLLY